jgi:hypothetical protein
MATPWRNRDSKPLDYREQCWVYEIQCYLMADKMCSVCGFWLPVQDFGGFACQPCSDCREQERRMRNAHWNPEPIRIGSG